MNGNEYQLKALRTANTDNKEELLLNGILGLCGETGEVADIIKKWNFQGHELDCAALLDELSDVMWYVAITSHAIGVTLDDVMQHNVDKLIMRYPNGFTVGNSLNRVEYDHRDIFSRMEDDLK